jgi:hypothetical protein
MIGGEVMSRIGGQRLLRSCVIQKTGRTHGNDRQCRTISEGRPSILRGKWEPQAIGFAAARNSILPTWSSLFAVNMPASGGELRPCSPRTLRPETELILPSMDLKAVARQISQ